MTTTINIHRTSLSRVSEHRINEKLETLIPTMTGSSRIIHANDGERTILDNVMRGPLADKK